MVFNLKANIVGCDSRTKKDYKRSVKLRETQTLYVTETGSRYKKSNGYPPKVAFPMYKLDLLSIEKVDTSGDIKTA